VTHANFAATYGEARQKFLTAAAARRAHIAHLTHPSARGAQGEELAIDIALVGNANASALLLLTSGTHGVEGFCGSGCQVALLNDGALLHSLEDVAVLLVHAVNPYGFSHLRRVNEDNVDLNRNFRDFSRPLPVNDAYARLHAHILPDTWPPAPEHDAVLGAYIAQHGLAAFQAVVSGGQYAFPDGLFYGGTQPAWSNACIRALLREHGQARTRLAWIDFHSGLGSFGHGEKIYAGHDDAVEVERARAWWGHDVTSFHDGSSVSAALRGAMYVAAYDECPLVEYTGIALEFGTVSVEEVFGALRADHWLHNHPEAPDAHRKAVNAAMRQAFYSDAPQWQSAVLDQARSVVEAALSHLQRTR
jgi:hypothetical protein